MVCASFLIPMGYGDICVSIKVNQTKTSQATYPRKSSLIVPMALIAATSGLTPKILRRKLVPFSITWSA